MNTAFNGPTPGGGNAVVLPIAFGDPVTGVAVSGFLDSGSGAPDYTSATEKVPAATSSPL